MVPSWPAVRREVVIARPLRAARVVPCGRLIVAMLVAGCNVGGSVVRVVGVRLSVNSFVGWGFGKHNG